MASPTTGRPRGRPKGAQNRRTDRREAAVAEAARAIGDVIPDAFGGDAHALLMAVYKDTRNDMELRLDAAKAAIRFEKPALASANVNASIRRTIAEFTLEELAVIAGSAGCEGGDCAPE